jgi:hypothetical protein
MRGLEGFKIEGWTDGEVINDDEISMMSVAFKKEVLTMTGDSTKSGDSISRSDLNTFVLSKLMDD